MADIIKKIVKPAPVISALLLLLGFNYASFWPLGLVALVPFIGWIYRQERAGQVFFWGLIFGLIFMGGVISWFWDAYPLDWAGIGSPAAGLGLLFFVWAASSLVFALFFGLWALVFWKLKRGRWTDFILGPSLWVAFEYLRAFAFSIFWAGPGALFGAHWSFGFLGYILANNAWLLRFAGLGGIYFLSFIVVLTNFLAYGLWRFWREGLHRRAAGIILAAAALVVSGSFVLYFADQSDDAVGERLRAALLTTNTPSVFYFSERAENGRLNGLYGMLESNKAGIADADLVVFPEDSRFLVAAAEFLGPEFAGMLFGGGEKLVIDSSPIKDGGGIYSRLFYFNTAKTSDAKTAFGSYYDKEFLMPNGEYMPYVTAWAAQLSGAADWAGEFSRRRGFSGGDDIGLGQARRGKIGALFCMEMMSPVLYGRLASSGAEVLVNTSSQAIFRGSRLLFKQTLDMAHVRAVENNRYLLQASNFAPSFIVDNRGRLLASSVVGEDAVLYGDVELISEKSWYNTMLDFFRYSM